MFSFCKMIWYEVEAARIAVPHRIAAAGASLLQIDPVLLQAVW
jgi:hypothetical protein